MKLLTIKDFINYNNPCISCKDKITIKIASSEIKTSEDNYININPTIIGNTLEIDLTIRYLSSHKLKINCINNKYECLKNGTQVDEKALTDYLSEHTLYFVSKCMKCFTRVRSSNIEFNLNKKFIAPLKISQEFIYFKENDSNFFVKSNYNTNTTKLTVYNNIRSSNINIDMPLQPLSKFKDRAALLSKMKTLVLFS